jgi:prepilin-type N-terminal cleavage/methylation domain-containing protein
MRSVECGVWSVECPTREVSLRPYSAFRLPPSALRPRRGLTLVELLITILIISILAGLILGVAALAGEKAREAQTRHVVSRLHTLLMEHYATYKTRRVRLSPAVEAAIEAAPQSQRGRLGAEARLYALRELMLMEIPDRWSDVYLADPGASMRGNPIYLDPKFLNNNGRTPLASVYLRRLQPMLAAINQVSGLERAERLEALTDNQGAECLYMIITLACGDGEARSLFGESSIGDTDGDSAPEFLDGWGNPINFLRWAPGFDSQIQIDANQLGIPEDNNTTWKTAASGDHDPFDLYRRDDFAFRLVPLIFSAGGDETFGIRLVKPYVAWVPQSTPPAGNMLQGCPRLSAYWQVNDGDGDDFLGTPYEGAADNIHNHLMGQR